MKLKTLIKAAVPFVFLCASAFSQASAVDVIGSSEIQKTVTGVWANNEKISFQSSGTYTLALTDFGLTSPGFGNNFSHLGAMISDSYHNIASVEFNSNSTNPNALFTFDVEAGDYWLSLFAITDSNTNVGTFNMSLLQGDVSAVPLPATFWFMATSVLGLVSFVRQRRAEKK